MQYLVSKDNFTKITEPKGTLQNISRTLTIEVSNTQAENSGVLLPPMCKIQFDGNSVYVRCVDGAGAEARVIPFEVVVKGGDGGGTDFSLDQTGTTIVEDFKFSALEYPNATNPNLDGKTVLVMAVKDANATTQLVKYVFVDLAKLVGTSTLYRPSDNAIGISGASIGLNLSASAGNILSVNGDGLYADLGVVGGVSGNFAVIGESGAIVDGGFSLADLAGLSAGKVFTGATSGISGLSGLVPAPQTGDELKFLRGDGTWSGELILPTVANRVNGGFWLDVSGNTPIPKYFYDGIVYTLGGSSGSATPSTPDYSENLVAYLPFETSATADVCGNEWTTEGNSVALDTSIKKFGSASLHTPAYSYIKANNVIDLNADKWTFDCWCYAVNRTSAGVFCLGSLASRKGIIVEGGTISVANSDGTGWLYETSRSTPTQLNQWTHLAVVRDGGHLYFFEAGQLIWHLENVGTIYDNAITAIGADSWSSDMNLYFDNVRIHNGVALWTEDFTPPTAADYS